MNFATKMTLLLVLLGGLAGCGDDGPSSKVKLSVNPKSPIVITGDGKDNSGNTITAPWFSYRLFVVNGPDYPLTIVNVKATVTLYDNGQTTEVSSSFPASTLNYTNEVADTTYNCTYFSIGEYARNASGYTEGMLTDPSLGAGGFCDDERGFGIILSSLPKPADPKSNNYRYRVEIEPQGWFGGRDEPVERFQKRLTFYTR